MGAPANQLSKLPPSELAPIFQRAIANVREDIADNPYLAEALRVLPVGGFRSAIGCFWNAVVDDLRNKILFRSVELFNKAVITGRKVQSYEDFQNYVNDDQLIEGAYAIGVIGWEASKVLKHVKETRHIFDGHPRSSEPSLVKVLAMLDDCVKYVLADPYPAQIINLDEYIGTMASDEYDRNDVAIENALSELPDVFKVELANRLFTSYVHPDASSVLRSNIEFAAPILWNVTPKDTKIQIVRRVDQEIAAGNAIRTKQAFAFVAMVKANRYLSMTARKYHIKPLLKRLAENQGKWAVENECVSALEPLAAYIPDELLVDYARSLVLTYVGEMGYSSQYSRTDFYADQAALRIPGMLHKFDDRAALAFVQAVRNNPQLKRRIAYPVKLNRLRALAHIVLERITDDFAERAFLELLVDGTRDEEILKQLK
jgi:hypothetical protein